MTNTKHFAALAFLMLVAFLATTLTFTVARASAAPTADVAPVDTTYAAWPLVVVGAQDTPKELWDALIAGGFKGVQGDACECLYIPVNMVMDVPGGTWTMTPTGLVGCRDWDTTGAECTDQDFLTRTAA